MKKFTFLAILALLAFGGFESGAQKKASPAVSAAKEDQSQQMTFRRCGTMEAIEARLKNDPAYRAQYEKSLRDFQIIIQPQTQRTARLTAPVIIPVAVHIVLPNPGIVTDADVQYFIDRLNRDFSGLNPDSANGAPFFGVRGHSMIRFAPARRDPSGNLTNGIERRVGNVQIADGEPQAIKSFASGGLNPWPFQQYYNLWIGVGNGGLLGIAPEIGVGTAANDGVCVDYRAFANNPCITDPSFNLGRTAVHEIGHNFGLFHTFQGGCSNADFQQLTTPSQQLPAALLAPSDDTPGQAASTSGCPNGAVATGCAAFPNPPGKMYQNYMDYTNDACYSMFTDGQVERMHYVLENFRAGYLTTQGHIPPANAIVLDAQAFESVNPGGYELNGCTVINYPSTIICGNTLTPKFRFKNTGLTVITSITAGYIYNNGAPVVQTFSNLNVPSGATLVFTLPQITLVPGTTTIKFFTSGPNGTEDQNAANDTLSTNIVTNPSLLATRISEGFEAAPAGWTVSNPNGDNTWGLTTPGRNSARSAFINNYDFNVVGNIDDLRSPLVTTAGIDSLYITFDVAHKNYPDQFDQLSVLAVTSCGTVFTPTGYSKSGATLATAGSTTDPYLNPAPGDWRSERIVIGANVLGTSGNALIAFRNTNGYGNNIFIDNVNIFPLFRRDLQLLSINQPGTVICAPAVTPSITVKNNGSDIITGYKVSYSIDNGATQTTTVTGVSIPRNATATITLPPATVAIGNHTITVYSWEPVSSSGTGDQNTINDTLRKNFVYVGTAAAPLVEGFESTTFPPANWAVINPDAGFTWQRASIGKNSTGSAFVNNFATTGTLGQRDDLVTPNIIYSGVDSVKLTFDLSAASRQYPGAARQGLDTLEVMVTRDCGNSFTTVYKKWGAALQTLNDPNNPLTTAFVPNSASQWRTETIDLTAFANNPSLQVYFRNTSNNGNNVYIDNINLTTRILPARLKEQGYLVLPTAFSSQFSIWHYRTEEAKELRFVTVYNAGGSMVYKRAFNGNAEKLISVDLSGQPAGTYIVTLGYNDSYRNVSERVIKR